MISGGRSLVSSLPAFSNDAKKLLICHGNTVSIFSTSTGLQITELEGHKALVTSVIVVPASTPASKILCYCWTASLDGTIRYWDFSVPELMKMIDIQLPIFSMVIPSLFSQSMERDEKTPDLFAYVSIGANKQDKQPNTSRGQIRKCNLTKSCLAGGVTLAETQEPEFITICPFGKYFGIRDKRKLRIWHVPEKDSERIEIKKMRLHHTKTLTILAFHPTKRIVAAGDVTGRILVWRGFGNRAFSLSNRLKNGRLMTYEDERPGVRGDDDADSCTTWHWHSSEVKLLLFSSDGAYLYSGGKEGVLVIWQLDTGKKKFLPRIGSPLLFFINSPDPSLSSISCADNQIHLMKMPSMEILKSIAGIKLPCSVPEICKNSFSGFVFDCAAGLVAVCAENYCIQFYSLFDDREISQVQICERNHQPGDELTVIVTLVALSLDGCVMSTVETRLPEEGIGGLVSLKFWMCGSQIKDFSLSTIIYEPHRESGVSAIAFHPTRRMSVSTSYGGDFKIWVGNQDIQQKDKMLQKTRWTCHAVGSYKKKPMTAAAFSADGSVLAVAAETVITLWDPEMNVLVAVIGDSLEPIGSLSFVGKSEYIVSTSRGSNPQVSVWSMSKLSITWSYKLHAEAVTCTQDGSSFAVLARLPESSEAAEAKETMLQSKDGAILLFKVGDPVPVATWFVKKSWGGGLAFLHMNPAAMEEMISDENPASLLAYVNSDHEYILFDPYGAQACERGVGRRHSLGGFQETGQFGYSSIYVELPEFDLKKNQTLPITFTPSERPWETIFSGPSHTLPPLTKLCSSFLESLLEKRTAAVE
ncbi:WD repeat-containing protein [Actinidia chinensis var. chinensis]|uniref:WD repeat-containing protein n=1 Tax=Actinidia chinensis var. chinensis TaxID=1590841 RepID=A0A2R6P5A2_ACTCC|nr:WD repeat-containing protein [Actinidia chinensis var. chinensis]